MHILYDLNECGAREIGGIESKRDYREDIF
jgi:hypothetical protein